MNPRPFFALFAPMNPCRTMLAVFLIGTAPLAVAGLFEEGQIEFERQDYRKALGRWNQAAARQDPRALYGVAQIHREGLGMAKNETPVLALYRRSAELGYAPAQFRLAECYFVGLFGAKEERTMAVELARQAAEHGHRPAAEFLSDAYGRGAGAARDYVESIFWGRVAMRLLREEVDVFGKKSARTAKEEEQLTLLRTSLSALEVTLAISQRGAGARWPDAATLKKIDERVTAFAPRSTVLTESAMDAVKGGNPDGAGFLSLAYEEAIGVKADPLESIYWLHVRDRILQAQIRESESTPNLASRTASLKNAADQNSRLRSTKEARAELTGLLNPEKLMALKNRADTFATSILGR